VNAEAALREWDAQAEERKLKKQQDAARNAKPQGPVQVGRFDEEEYEEMLEGARNRVSDALAAATAACVTTSSSSGAASSSGTASSSGAASSSEVAAADGMAGTPAGAHQVAPTATTDVNASIASGKRKLGAAEGKAATTSKTAKLWDPLAALEGQDSEDSEDSEGSGAEDGGGRSAAGASN